MDTTACAECAEGRHPACTGSCACPICTAPPVPPEGDA